MGRDDLNSQTLSSDVSDEEGALAAPYLTLSSSGGSHPAAPRGRPVGRRHQWQNERSQIRHRRWSCVGCQRRNDPPALSDSTSCCRGGSARQGAGGDSGWEAPSVLKPSDDPVLVGCTKRRRWSEVQLAGNAIRGELIFPRQCLDEAVQDPLVRSAIFLGQTSGSPIYVFLPT